MAGSNEDVRSEINYLKKNYECKVIENIGNFDFIITIYLVNKKASVKFQLTDEYPKKSPEVVVSGLVWQGQDLELFKSANDNFNMTSFVKFVESCLENNKVSVEETVLLSKNKTRKKTNKKEFEDENCENEKKVSMRTAEDVIKRIKWDPLLKPADFTVGYLDRFLGVIENNFTVFNWDDLASVDYSDTAIPKHRIHYFKYKSAVVWDKTKRIDDIFGSTGSNMTIKDVIENYIEMDEPSDCHEENNCEMEIVTSFPKEKINHKRPNYFICYRVKDKQILTEIQQVQDKIVSNDKSFEKFIVPQERIHLTLCTLGLYTNDDMNMICKILEENKNELMHLSSSVSLELKKVEQFFNRVVYCKVTNNEQLLTFVDHLKLIIQEKGLRICDAFDFVPHITLMKVPRDESFKTIPRRIYEDYEDTEFGCVGIDDLILCEISKNREADGFYKYHYKLSFK